jgi:hypothetical protein
MFSAMLIHLLAFTALSAADTIPLVSNECAYSASSASDTILSKSGNTLQSQAVLIEAHSYKRDESSNKKNKRNKFGTCPSHSLAETFSFVATGNCLPAKGWSILFKGHTGKGMQLKV